MARFILLLTFSFFSSLGINTISFGGIEFDVVQNGESNRRYIWLHGDEQTAKMALDQHIKSNEGVAFYIKNKPLREVDYEGGLMDPNRLFSPSGIRQNILKYNPDWSSAKKRKIQTTFDTERDVFLKKIFPENGGLFIAIHNNFRGYNVNREIDRSDAVSIKSNQNPRDFILCTNRSDFELLAKSPYNVVLQEKKWEDKRTDEDDGSLSWAALRHDVRYILLETRLGWLKQQIRMLDYIEKNLP